ncbi:uncharacterized protein LOC101769320 isoform X1 [Setaria italica]|nr:uncharacterized protein LOC101769320 isoform X1 [Setaria italica]
MSVPLVWPKNVMSSLLTKAHFEKHRRGKKARGRRKTARDRRKRAGGAEVTVASPDGSFFESVVYCFDPVHHSLFSWKKQPLKFHSKLLRWKKRLTQKRPTKHTMIQIQLLGLLPQVGMEFSTSDEAWAFWLRFVCAKEGRRSQDKRDHLTKCPRAETRTECQIYMNLKMDRKKEIQKVPELVLEHNHALHPPETLHLMVSQRLHLILMEQRRLLFLLRWCGHLGVAGYLPRGGAALGVAVAGILDGGGCSSEPYHFVIVDDDGNE